MKGRGFVRVLGSYAFYGQTKVGGGSNGLMVLKHITSEGLGKVFEGDFTDMCKDTHWHKLKSGQLFSRPDISHEIMYS